MTADKTYPYMVDADPNDLRANIANPNEQDARTFNALCSSIEDEGWIEPMATVVQTFDEDGLPEPGYEILSGHHRVEAAKSLGLTAGPVFVLDPDTFDKDRRDWNMVKVNQLRGKLNPKKFSELYNRLADKYGAEVLRANMGFTDEDSFKAVYLSVKRTLPPELQDALEAQKGEIKTIDDLSKVLNALFKAHGEDLPSNFMVFSHGGKEVLWVRADKELWNRCQELVEEVRGDPDLTMDAAMKALLIRDDS